jgi:hypothetical protein
VILLTGVSDPQWSKQANFRHDPLRDAAGPTAVPESEHTAGSGAVDAAAPAAKAARDLVHSRVRARRPEHMM